jgi:hypothetical protein
MSCFGDELTGVLLQKTAGHGSQVSEQQDERSDAADRTTHPAKAARAAKPSITLRSGISIVKALGRATLFRLW